MEAIKSEVQALVQLVLDRLSRVAGAAQPSLNKGDVQPEPPSPVRTVVISADQVRSWTSVDGRMILPKQAVITPAAWDLIRERGWRVMRGTSDQQSLPSSDPTASHVRPLDSSIDLLATDAVGLGSIARIPLVITGNISQSKQIQARFCPKRVRVLEYAADDAAMLLEARKQLRDSTERVLLLVDHAYATAWQAGRCDDLRAAVLTDLQELIPLLCEVPINLLIVKRSQWNAGALVNIVRTWLKHSGIH